MKKYLRSLFLLCAMAHLCVQAQAQAKTQTRASAQRPKPSRWSIAFTAGPAIPVGAFAGTHSEYAHKGVSVGSTAELDAAYRISPFLSAVLAVNGQVNHGNGISVAEEDLVLFRNGQYHQGALANYWQLTRVLAGGSLTLPLSKHGGPALLLRAMGGIQKTRVPAFSYVDIGLFVAPGYSNVLRAPAQTLGGSFAYQLDAGMKWSFKRRWAFLAYAGYDGSRPSATHVAEAYPGPLYTNAKIPVPTGTISIRAGVEVNL